MYRPSDLQIPIIRTRESKIVNLALPSTPSTVKEYMNSGTSHVGTFPSRAEQRWPIQKPKCQPRYSGVGDYQKPRSAKNIFKFVWICGEVGDGDMMKRLFVYFRTDQTSIRLPNVYELIRMKWSSWALVSRLETAIFGIPVPYTTRAYSLGSSTLIGNPHHEHIWVREIVGGSR